MVIDGSDVVNGVRDASWERLVRENPNRWQDYIHERVIIDDHACWQFQNRARNRQGGAPVVCVYLGAYKTTTVDVKKLSYVAFIDFAHGLSVRHGPVQNKLCANPEHLRCGVTPAMHNEVTPRLIVQVKALHALPARLIGQRLQLGTAVVAAILRGQHPLQANIVSRFCSDSPRENKQATD